MVTENLGTVKLQCVCCPQHSLHSWGRNMLSGAQHKRGRGGRARQVFVTNTALKICSPQTFWCWFTFIWYSFYGFYGQEFPLCGRSLMCVCVCLCVFCTGWSWGGPPFSSPFLVILFREIPHGHRHVKKYMCVSGWKRWVSFLQNVWALQGIWLLMSRFKLKIYWNRWTRCRTVTHQRRLDVYLWVLVRHLFSVAKNMCQCLNPWCWASLLGMT